MLHELDPLLHSRLRLAIVSTLIAVEKAEFAFLLEKTQSTSGNLSVQLDKLQEVGYIKISKSFKGKYPLTTCAITKKGINAFEKYVKDLKAYLHPKK